MAIIIKNGKRYMKALIIEDSWGPNYGKGGQRIITEDFHNKRNWFVAHPMNFQFEITEIPEIVTFQFKINMKFGDKNNDVMELQKRLQILGFYPVNSATTGYFGSVTKASVIKYQKVHNLTPDGSVGILTRNALNS